jgi:GntR family transcriptional regulator
MSRSRRRSDEVRRVRDVLRQDLAELAAGTGLLPDERLLTLRLGTSRNAVREALNLLRDEGLVERRQGRGTVVVAAPPLSGSAAQGLVNEVAGGSERVHYEPLWHYEVPATGTVARRLGLADGAPAMVLERLTVVDEVPTFLWTTYLRLDDGARVAATASDGDGFQLLEQALGVQVTRIEMSVEAVLADESVADLLQVRVGQPLLRFERLVLDARGRPVAVGFGRAAGDRIAMRMSTDRTLYPPHDTARGTPPVG